MLMRGAEASRGGWWAGRGLTWEESRGGMRVVGETRGGKVEVEGSWSETRERDGWMAQGSTWEGN